MNHSILLVDDHSMVRKGIASTLQTDFGYKRVSGVASCKDLMKVLRNNVYTHLILDINLKDGSSVEMLHNIRALYPNMKIAILTMLPSVSLRKVARTYSINFIIGKGEAEEDVNRKLANFLQNVEPSKSDLDWETDNPFSDLSAREMEVLHYWLKGFKNQEIADQLNLAKQSVTTYKNRILEKTCTKNIKELEVLAEAFGVNS